MVTLNNLNKWKWQYTKEEENNNNNKMNYGDFE